MTEAQPTASRLFFAIWPDESLRRRLLQWQHQLLVAGQPIPGERLHLTLSFLGDVDECLHKVIVQGAAQLRVPQFKLRLDRTGYFARPQIAWLGPSETPTALVSLHQQLRKLVADRGIATPGKEFKPHVSLARKAARPPLPVESDGLDWPVDEFALVRSHLGAAGPQYNTIARFPLCADPTRQ